MAVSINLYKLNKIVFIEQRIELLYETVHVQKKGYLWKKEF